MSYAQIAAQYTNVNNFKRVKQTYDDEHNTKHDGSHARIYLVDAPMQRGGGCPKTLNYPSSMKKLT